jgi:hypothetical protein
MLTDLLLQLATLTNPSLQLLTLTDLLLQLAALTNPSL